jgi:flagellar biosynthesis/type III secretory pathway M-ring protein FliF/YscJ
MAAIDRPSAAVVLARFRALWDRLWHPLAAQRPAVKWALALVVFLALAAVSYWGVGSFSTLGVRYLASSRRFSSDDLIKVCRALEKQRIAYRVDEHRRVEVASDQFDQAAEAISKLDVGQHPIDEIRDGGDSIGFWDGQAERDKKEKRKLEKILERLISDQEGVLSPLVTIDLPHSAGFSRHSPKPTAFVYVETEGGRALPYRTIQAIPAILAANVRDLAPGSITVMDSRGNRYLDPGNPALGDNSRNRAREEEIGEEILEKLDWIKGVRVQVQVITPHAQDSSAATIGTGASQKSNGLSAAASTSSRTDSPSRDHRGGASQPKMVANQPLVLEGDREGGSAAGSTGPAPQSAAVRGAGPSHASASEAAAERGRVVVRVPRSFYYKMQLRNDDRDPSPEERLVMTERTERQIRTLVSLVLPASDAWKVEVDTIPDDITLSRPAALPSAPDLRHRFIEWAIVGGLGVGVSTLVVAASWLRMGRRPARPPEPAASARRYHVDSGSQPSPSERVRELIQRNPEAAASVLQRWVGQGGRSS